MRGNRRTKTSYSSVMASCLGLCPGDLHYLVVYEDLVKQSSRVPRASEDGRKDWRNPSKKGGNSEKGSDEDEVQPHTHEGRVQSPEIPCNADSRLWTHSLRMSEKKLPRKTKSQCQRPLLCDVKPMSSLIRIKSPVKKPCS